MKSPFTVTVGNDGAPMRLDLFLAAHMGSISRSQIQKLIDLDLVQVNGALAKKRDIVNVDDQIVVDMDGASKTWDRTIVPQDIPLTILFEDEAIIVLNKPAGLVVHPGNGNRDGTLVNALLFHTDDLSAGLEPDRPGIVHRLDKDTTGVMVVAKSSEAHTALARQFSNRGVAKYYLGICIGTPPAQHGILDFPLGRSNRDPLRRTVLPTGKPSQTEYWVLHEQSEIAVLRFSLHTGRTHQVRAHCSHVHMPIVADEMYGGGRDRIMQIQPLQRPFAHKVYKCFSRHALHAHTLAFDHPISGERMHYTAEPPEDFQRALSQFNAVIALT